MIRSRSKLSNKVVHKAEVKRKLEDARQVWWEPGLPAPIILAYAYEDYTTITGSTDGVAVYQAAVLGVAEIKPEDEIREEQRHEDAEIIRDAASNVPDNHIMSILIEDLANDVESGSVAA